MKAAHTFYMYMELETQPLICLIGYANISQIYEMKW